MKITYNILDSDGNPLTAPVDMDDVLFARLVGIVVDEVKGETELTYCLIDSYEVTEQRVPWWRRPLRKGD